MTIHLSTPEGNREISHEPGLSVLEILTREGYPVNSSCGGNGVCGKCSVKILENIPPSAGDFARLSAQSIEAGFRLSCTIRPQGDLHVVLPAMRLAWRRMKDEEFLPVEPASGKTCAAVDLGTTHIRISLWDGGRRLEGRAFLNPQRAWGADLLTRLAQAQSSQNNALKIRKLAENAISGAISEMALHHAVNIDEKWLVGNTAMMALLSGRNSDLLLDPDNWTKRLDCAPIEGDIRFVPPLGGFVGSDILAGIEATHLSKSPPGTLLVDFGTNSEMALWDGKRILATSAAGGPAFEGGGISCGMPAEAGAIFRVDDHLGHEVLEGGTPLGLCGSGLVDAVAVLARLGHLDRIGRFRSAQRPILAEGIALSPGDIDSFQRAKAAIAAGIARLCDKAGIPVSDIERIHACGAFGNHLNVENAIATGLLPPAGEVLLCANAALGGCESLMLSEDANARMEAILSLTEVFNLAQDPEFENLFMENLYLQPMTN